MELTGSLLPLSFPREAVVSRRLHRGPLNAVEVTRKGNTAYLGGDDGQVFSAQLVEPRGGKSFLRVESLLTSSKPVLAIALSPDEQLLAVAQTSQIVLFNTKTKTLSGRLNRVKGRITSLSWDPRGELLAIGRANGDVIVWHVRGSRTAGMDDLRALEFYVAGTTPVIAIQFHPSAGIFFAAEDDGSITLWRLLRTESEVGLRDESAEMDKERKSEAGKKFAQRPSPITDLWLSPDGAFLFASSRDGTIASWRVRGLVPLGNFMLGKDEVFSVAGAPFRKGTESHLLVSSGRDQELHLLCQTVPPSGPNDDVKPIRVELARSETLPKPISRIRLGRERLVAWGGDQEGNVLLFDVPAVLSSPALKPYFQQCFHAQK